MAVRVLCSIHIQGRLQGKKTGHEIQDKIAVGRTLLSNQLPLGWGKELVKMGCRAEIMFKPFVLFRFSISAVRCIKGLNSIVSIWVDIKMYFF